MREQAVTLTERESIVNLVDEPGTFYLVTEVRPDGYVHLSNPHDADDCKVVGLGEIESVFSDATDSPRDKQ
ncbi:MAG: hypothetical protein KBE09_04030 [Candidatus Pacebacteria bacterium]|nr:hypothetical protein [Candidatus Paceibacterota bacterium]